MKIVCMHLKLFLCFTSLLILLGIITVTPCQSGAPHSLLSRSYALDTGRIGELIDKIKDLITKMCRKRS